MFSNLYQTFPPPIEVLFSYEAGRENSPEILRESLAKVLVKFYPFAGCLTRGWDGKLLARCTGDGVPSVEAVLDNDLDDLGDITILAEKKLRKFVCCMQGVTVSHLYSNATVTIGIRGDNDAIISTRGANNQTCKKDDYSGNTVNMNTMSIL